MRIRVLLFAVLRDAAQTAEVDIKLSDSATAADAIQAVEEKHPQISKFLSRAAIAVNRKYVDRQTIIHEGDEVALIPPVSGG